MRLRQFPIAMATLAAWLTSLAALAQPAVPDALEPWRDWVLYGEEHRRCPMLNGRGTEDPDNYICAWPGELALDVDVERAAFRQTWTLYDEDWLPLPGSADYWPGALRVDGEPRAAVLRGGRPMLRVEAGEHTVAGELTWTARPASIPVPSRTGLIALTLDGVRVGNPDLDAGVLWLGLRPDLEVEEDRLSVEVYRRLSDSLPIRIETRIELDVAGQSRELALAGPLLQGFVGESLTSDLPAQLDPDGSLRIQVRPGRWIVTVVAHHPQMVAQLARPAGVEPWPDDEIWSFQSFPRFRVAALEGAPAVDSERSGVPAEWRQLPSYRVGPEQSLNLVERSRNDASEPNRLSLRRDLWLDFDGGAYTSRDVVSGQMRSRWRLDMAAPYTMTMASIDEDNLLITAGFDPDSQGVELREASLQLTATARLPALGRLPVTGYLESFDAVATTLHLPPAHRLVAAPGADQAGGAWLERWRLLDIFLALIIAVAAWRLFGPLVGGVALATMILVFHEPFAPRWAWLNLLFAIALLRVAPQGRLRTVCQRYRFVSLAALGLLLIPFVAGQLRVVVFPQLERGFLERGIAVASFGRGAGLAPESFDAAALNRARAVAEQPSSEFEAVVVTGSRIGGDISRYLPGALVQTGPGLPDWAWTQYRLRWSGPVAAGQTFSVVIFGPWLVSLWRVAGVALALALLGLLLKPDFRWPRGLLRAGGGATAALAAALLVLPNVGDAQSTDAFPSPELLRELRARLTEPAPCQPACAELTSARVEVDGDSLSVELELAVQDTLAVPLPGDREAWQPQTIVVDGSRSGFLYRDNDGRAWLRLAEGVRRVALAGTIPAVDSLSLPFPLTPRRIVVDAPGWDVAGVSNGRLPSGNLELIRQRQDDDEAGGELQATAFPPYVRVIREIAFDLDWAVTTTVERVAPAQLAFTLGVDLLPDEAVVTPGIEVVDNTATVAFAAGQRVVRWESRIPTAAALRLSMREDAPWSENWRFVVGHVWHADYAGFPATPPEFIDPDFYTPEYYPRPGEALELSLSRPEPVSGDTIAIDRVDYTRNVGDRSSQSTLAFEYRSTRGREHLIRLPPGSELGSVQIDGQTVPLQLNGDQLGIPATPGRHNVAIDWRNTEGASLRATVAPVDLGAGISNIKTALRLPGDRWVLYGFGPTLGPAVLYWAELLVFVVAAVLLGRIAASPLRTHEWLLLGLGLSTFAWPVLLLFGVWAFVMSWRGRTTPALSKRWFNALQVGLALLSAAALIALLGAIPAGLLGAPDMHIVSPVEFGSLSWFADRSDGVTPAAGAISVSLWFYKAAMLAWALWLSFALLRWLPWSWRAYSHAGAWR